jgi:hypothetical protein
MLPQGPPNSTTQHHPILLCTQIYVVACSTLATVKQMVAQIATEWKASRVPIMRTQLSRMEVAIPEMCEQDETPQMSQGGSESAGSFILHRCQRTAGRKAAGQLQT